MSVPVFQATIVNGVGDLLPAATITVLVEATGQPAVLYSDRNGTVPLGTLGVFSVDAEAFAQFFAASGNYRVTANDSGSGFSRTWDYVVLTSETATAEFGLLSGNALAADDINANGDIWGAGNVEYGANANGEYWKYPDGLLICRHTDIGVRSFGAFATAAWFGGFTLVFPTAYITSPTVSSSITTSGQITWVEAAPATTTDCVFTLIANAQLVSVNVEVSFTAVGRWK